VKATPNRSVHRPVVSTTTVVATEAEIAAATVVHAVTIAALAATAVVVVVAAAPAAHVATNWRVVSQQYRCNAKAHRSAVGFFVTNVSSDRSEWTSNPLAAQSSHLSRFLKTSLCNFDHSHREVRNLFWPHHRKRDGEIDACG